MLESSKEHLIDCRDKIYQVSGKITAIAYLLSNQGESRNGVVELIGLGNALADWASELNEISNNIYTDKDWERKIRE